MTEFSMEYERKKKIQKEDKTRRNTRLNRQTPWKVH